MLRTLAADPEGTLKTSLQPWQLLFLILAGWVNPNTVHLRNKLC
jgi:hypothetical protein